MDVNLKNIRLFATEAEREKARRSEIEKDMQYGNPKEELRQLEIVSKWGVWIFHFITAASTTVFIYRVIGSHLAELFGGFGSAMAFGIGVIAAFVIELILTGTWKPFFKKMFNTGSFDVILFTLGIMFTAVTLKAAFAGVDIMAEDSAGQLKVESVVASQATYEKAMKDIDGEIATLSAGKGKGVFSWKGKPTPQAQKRITELQKEKGQRTENMTALSSATGKANDISAMTYETKLKKAQGYLGLLAAISEIIKLILYTFLGYWSLQLKKWNSGEIRIEKNVIPNNEAPKNVITQYNEEEEVESAIDEVSPPLPDMSEDMLLSEISRLDAQMRTYRSKLENGLVTNKTYSQKMSSLMTRKNDIKGQLQLLYSTSR